MCEVIGIIEKLVRNCKFNFWSKKWKIMENYFLQWELEDLFWAKSLQSIYRIRASLVSNYLFEQQVAVGGETGD